MKETGESGSVNILLISNSKLLKSKFISSISSDTNSFSSMNRIINDNEKQYSFSCHVSDYTTSIDAKLYSLQLIDVNDKGLIGHLMSTANSSFPVNGIVYLYDELNSDTFAYVNSIHAEIKKLMSDNFDSLSCLLFNLVDGSNLNLNRRSLPSEDDMFQLTMKLDTFLTEFNNIQYVRLDNSDELKELINDKNNQTNESRERARNTFDSLIERFAPCVKKEDKPKSSESVGQQVRLLRKNFYKGEMLHNLRNGFGIYVFENTFFRYEGQWAKGVKHGLGKLIMKDGSFYEGEFRDGEITGKGYKYDKSRETEYTGEFVEGVYEGRGVLRCKMGFVYEGDFSENMRHGYGELTEFKPNQAYKGQWYLNRRHGQGVQRYPDGSQYSGDWIRDKRQGQGEWEDLNGSVYEGQWRNDMMNGIGFYKHHSGYIYEGLFENGIPANMGVQLSVSVEGTKLDSARNRYEITEGPTSSFSVRVRTLNENNEIFKEEERPIQLTLGIKCDLSDKKKYENQIFTEL